MMEKTLILKHISRMLCLLISYSKFTRTIKEKSLRYIADSDIIFPVSRFAEVVYEICKCK